MTHAAKDILERHHRVALTFAGEGPDEPWLRGQFETEGRVQFIKYLPAEAMKVHLAHDIAVIPSIACEGTSLSVAEAMGAGCAVVATAVGGITNMIINGYNGLLVMPDAASLTRGLDLVVSDPRLRRRLGCRAYATARDAFSLPQWTSRWREVLEELANGEPPPALAGQ